MKNYHLRITYHPFQNPPTFISSELKKYGPHIQKRNLTNTLINVLVLSQLDYSILFFPTEPIGSLYFVV